MWTKYNGLVFLDHPVKEDVMMLCLIMLMRCRHIPASEIVAIARYLANVFACDFESLPTELLIHSYWTLMPHQFSNVRAYSRCLQTRLRPYLARTCDSVNPYYCGRRFGEQVFLKAVTI